MAKLGIFILAEVDSEVRVPDKEILARLYELLIHGTKAVENSVLGSFNGHKRVSLTLISFGVEHVVVHRWRLLQISHHLLELYEIFAFRRDFYINGRFRAQVLRILLE